MPCYSPLQAYFLHDKHPRTGRPLMTFKEPSDFVDTKFIPCGRCIGCRLERSRQWAMRCLHESKLYKRNCFITLTYNEDNLPSDLSLNHRHFQLFFKKLRRKYGNGIRYFMCGEYGEKFGRPHYHACVFNFDFDDKKLWKVSNGFRLYTSDALNELWSKGFCVIGDVTFESAAYVARYIMKKVIGKDAFDHYCDKDTGVYREPEYTNMSRNPGIGSDFIEKYFFDVYPRDSVVFRGREMRPPKYYDFRCESAMPDLYEDIKFKRQVGAAKLSDDNTRERLYVREEVKMASITRLFRGLEKEI